MSEPSTEREYPQVIEYNNHETFLLRVYTLMYVFTVLQDSLVVSEPSTEREYPQVIEFNDEVSYSFLECIN